MVSLKAIRRGLNVLPGFIIGGQNIKNKKRKKADASTERNLQDLLVKVGKDKQEDRKKKLIVKRENRWLKRKGTV